jgi:predicted PurR-regulated permease PerM
MSPKRAAGTETRPNPDDFGSQRKDTFAMVPDASKNWHMTGGLAPRRVLCGAICLLSLWILHGFVEALLAACVIAVASWPLYVWFSARLPPRIGKGAAAVVFTFVLSVVVLAPLAFACWALLGEAHSLLLDIAQADTRGLVAPDWLANAPVAGAWLAEQGELAHPGALLRLTQRADAAALFGWAQSVGHFTARNLLIVGFTVLLLCFLFREGESLARELTRALQDAIGDRAKRYLDVSTRAVRGVVNSMLVVGLFDAAATAIAYSLAGTPRALLWAAITGALAAVPFLGYAAVGAMALELTVRAAGPLAASSLVLGCMVLLCGDKLVRPMVARGELHLPFVWVLMGSIGGFNVLGLAGLVIGPVVLSLVREIYGQRVQEGNACPGAKRRGA